MSTQVPPGSVREREPETREAQKPRRAARTYLRPPSMGWLGLVVLIVVVLLVLLPLGRLFMMSLREGSFTAPGDFTLDNYARAYTSGQTYRVMFATGVFAISTTVISVTVAAVFAWLVERTDMPLRNMAWVLMLLPLATPGILGAISWTLLLSPRSGTLNEWIRAGLSAIGIRMGEEGPFNINTMAGMIFVASLFMIPTIFLMVVGSFRLMDPSLEETARVCGASQMSTVKRVTLPLMLPALLVAGSYSFMNLIESFEIPLALGLPGGVFVLSSLIYFTAQLNAPVDYGLAGAYASMFVVIGILLVFGYHRIVRFSEKYATISGKGYRPARIELGRWRYVGLATFVIYAALSFGVPTLMLLWRSLFSTYRAPSVDALQFASLDNYTNVVTSRGFTASVWNTFLLLTLTAVLTMVLSVFVSWVVVRGSGRGKRLLDAIVFVSIGIPGVVIALALIALFLYPPGSYVPLYGSIWIIVIALVIQYLAFGTRVTNVAILQVSEGLEEAARVSGVDQFRIVLRITLPLITPAFISGFVWVAVHAMRTLTAPLMLSSRDNEVVAVALWRAWDLGRVGEAAAFGILLILVLGVVTLVARRQIIRGFGGG